MKNVSDSSPLSQKFMAAILLAQSGDDKRAADLLREMGEIIKSAAKATPPTGTAKNKRT